MDVCESHARDARRETKKNFGREQARGTLRDHEGPRILQSLRCLSHQDSWGCGKLFSLAYFGVGSCQAARPPPLPDEPRHVRPCPLAGDREGTSHGARHRAAAALSSCLPQSCQFLSSRWPRVPSHLPCRHRKLAVRTVQWKDSSSG